MKIHESESSRCKTSRKAKEDKVSTILVRNVNYFNLNEALHDKNESGHNNVPHSCQQEHKTVKFHENRPINIKII